MELLWEKVKKNNKFVFVLLGDAECSEGSIWEAALFAKQHSLDNLIAIVDDNKIEQQITQVILRQLIH